jgi:hypothetical protein
VLVCELRKEYGQVIPIGWLCLSYRYLGLVGLHFIGRTVRITCVYGRPGHRRQVDLRVV